MFEAEVPVADSPRHFLHNIRPEKTVTYRFLWQFIINFTLTAHLMLFWSFQ